MSVFVFYFLQCCPKGLSCFYVTKFFLFLLQCMFDRNQLEKRDFRGNLPFREG